MVNDSVGGEREAAALEDLQEDIFETTSFSKKSFAVYCREAFALILGGLTATTVFYGSGSD